MLRSQRLSLVLSLLSTGGMTLASHVQAQNLVLGLNSQNQSGPATATLSPTGTSESGPYEYSDDGTGVPLSAQTSYTSWYVLGNCTESISGGSIGVLHLDSSGGGGSSTANISGGSLMFIRPDSNSTANISGGSIGEIDPTGMSITNVSGGTIGTLHSDVFSQVNVTAGNIGTLKAADKVFDNLPYFAIVNVQGGTIGAIQATNSSTVFVVGGNVTSFSTADTSLIDILGTGLTETFLGTFSNYTEYSITGHLHSGDVVNSTYFDYGGTLEFNGGVPPAIPEASTTVSLGLLLALGMGGLVVAKRKKAASAP